MSERHLAEKFNTGIALSIARDGAFRDVGKRLRELVPRAMQVLESRLADDDFQAAVRVLKMARVDGQIRE